MNTDPLTPRTLKTMTLDLIPLAFPPNGKAQTVGICLSALEILSAEAEDYEAAHIYADRILISLLRTLGEEQRNPLLLEATDLFLKIPRYYA